MMCELEVCNYNNFKQTQIVIIFNTLMNFQQPNNYSNPTININQTNKPINYYHSSLPIHPPSPFVALDHKQTKQTKQRVREMHFQKKMQAIDKKQEGYKRSTNNCHKKYISILKNLLFLKLNNHHKDQILSTFHQYRNSRVYYFINLCFLKWKVDVADIRWIFQHFCQDLTEKIQQYRLQISKTTNTNYINFRKDQIIEMDYSLQAIIHFLKGQTKQAVRVLYQKNKNLIIKQNQYIRSLKIIAELQEGMRKQYEGNIGSKLESIHMQQLLQWEKQKEAKQQEENCHEEQRQEQQKRQKQFSVKKEGEEKYPLLAFENSYQAMTDLKFQSWVIQKQKMLEFQIKKREYQLCQKRRSFRQQYPFQDLPEQK